MEQYINKASLVAEIESLKRTTFTNFDEGVNCAAQTFLEILDTIEVKDANEALRTEYEKGRADVIEKAYKFLKSYRQDTLDGAGYIAGIMNDKTIEDFRKAMEE